MPAIKLVKVRNKETGYEYATQPYLVDDETETNVEYHPNSLTCHQIAEVLSSHAENANYHDFVGFFPALAEIVENAAGPQAAARIFLDLAEVGGYEAGS